MSIFNVELKKVIDDSYEIEIGYELQKKLIADINAGLVGNIKKYVVVTDSNVKPMYADKILELLISNGYKAESHRGGEFWKIKQEKQKSMLKIRCLN